MSTVSSATPVYRIAVPAAMCIATRTPAGRPIIIRGLDNDAKGEVARIIDEYGGGPESEWIDVDPRRMDELPDDMAGFIADSLERLLEVYEAQAAEDAGRDA